MNTERRELLIENDVCPECGGELDTGWECNLCGFDALPEQERIPQIDPVVTAAIADLEGK